MNAIVGCTGFVGSNIYVQGRFEKGYHSQNIKEAYGLQPDLLVYAGLKAEKYLADHEPEKDKELIAQAEENISQIHPKKLVLISTIDVFENPFGVYEDTVVKQEEKCTYGWNRYRLECWVRENYPDALIIRLPGLFGRNIKKNFIYDYINIIPAMLKREKLDELTVINSQLRKYYELQDNGFYKCRILSEKEKLYLRNEFLNIGFTALHFTDSRSKYQFYPLDRLWTDICLALEQDIRLWHPAVEPVSAGELYRYLSGKEFCNLFLPSPADYDCRTMYNNIFGGTDGYICGKSEVMERVRKFVCYYSN